MDSSAQEIIMIKIFSLWWSRMASYLAVSTSHEVIKVRVLNFKMAASGFVNVTEGVLNVIKKTH